MNEGSFRLGCFLKSDLKILSNDEGLFNECIEYNSITINSF